MGKPTFPEINRNITHPKLEHRPDQSQRQSRKSDHDRSRGRLENKRHLQSQFRYIRKHPRVCPNTKRCRYDTNETIDKVTLRSDESGEITQRLEDELNSRLAIAGIEIVEARINYLAYASEIASVMLRRQQADAIISARERIVEGAVSMVHLALEKLEKDGVVELDEERKAAMVSNLLVVLCADESAQPVVNTGTLYQ